jgi:hypothetical protein
MIQLLFVKRISSPFDFSAVDSDGDSLSYAFTDAYYSSQGTTADNAVACPVTHRSHYISYAFPFSGKEPMGSGVKINPVTGIVSGIAPGAEGTYVVTCTITEYKRWLPVSFVPRSRNHCTLRWLTVHSPRRFLILNILVVKALPARCVNKAPVVIFKLIIGILGCQVLLQILPLPKPQFYVILILRYLHPKTGSQSHLCLALIQCCL